MSESTGETSQPEPSPDQPPPKVDQAATRPVDTGAQEDAARERADGGGYS